METYVLFLSIIAIINMGILAMLISLFGKMYVVTRAQLPLGLIVMAVSLLLHNAIGAMLNFSDELLISDAIFPYLMGVEIIELIGLSIFLKITMD